MDGFGDKERYYEEIKGFFLVDKRQNIVIDSGKIYHEEESRAYLAECGLEPTLFSSIQRVQEEVLFAKGSGTRDCRIYYIQGIFKRSYSRPDGYLVVELDEAFLERQLAIYGGAEGAACYLTLDEGGYLGTDTLGEQMTMKIAEKDSGSGTISFQGERYVYSIRASDCLKINYCYVTTSYSYYKDVYITLVFTMISLVVLLAVGILFARMFTKRNTEPLHRIMETMYHNGQREYSFTYETIMQEVSGLTGKIKSYEDRENREFLSQIFSGQERSEKKLLEYQRNYAPELAEGFYVLGVRLMDLTELSDFDILVFCISNIFGEMLEGYTQLQPVENWDRVYFLVKVKSEDVEERIAQSLKYLESRLSINVACGFSSQLSQFTQLREGKQQADYMMEYQELNQQFSKPLWYEEVMDVTLSGNKDYSSDLKKMMHLVMAEDYAGSMALLEEMWKNASASAYKDLNNSRARMLTLMSIITIPYKEKYGKTGVLQKETWNTLPEIFQDSMEMLQRLDRTEENTSGERIFDKMREYIVQHATDPAITAGGVCEAFQLTASYASGMYKRYAGEGILDAIHKERVRQAKSLLKEGLAVQEVAVRTGYLDARGFIRAFKKYEGITPGQYKNI